MVTNPQTAISDALSVAIGSILDIPANEVDPIVRRSQNPEHGDYQANGAMGLGKRFGQNPQDLAMKIISVVDFGSVAEPPTVAGPGFINIRLTESTVQEMVAAMDTPGLGVEGDKDPHAVAIDLCGVNVAKQLHVGHLRSTIIGDSIARIFERLGRTVYRENHLGDWGLPIAMVLEQLLEAGVDLDNLSLNDLNSAYQDAQLGASDDLQGADTAKNIGAGIHRRIELEEQNRSAVAAQGSAKELLLELQGGCEEKLAQWQKLIDCTMRSVYSSLELLNVKLGPENNRGESFYSDRLEHVVRLFTERGLAVEDGGAIVVRFEDRERPMLIRKSDGGYLYATTDLAAIEYRTQELKANLLIYVVDARQRDHFKDLFDGARLAGWDKTPDGADVVFVHAPFGSVLGEDKRPLKTRSGSNVTLSSLLEEAVERGTGEVIKRAKETGAPTHGMSSDELNAIGRQIGIGAIKYADLSNDLVRDYVFDMDRMVAFEGNTGPYIQYAGARISSLLRKTDLDQSAEIRIQEPQERLLAIVLHQYGSILRETANNLEPHRLCTWLYELTDAFNSFYQACPILKAGDEHTRQSRLRLADLTRRVLVDGLDSLGIESPQHM
jgi:arginyl-tRNA synthetase